MIHATTGVQQVVAPSSPQTIAKRSVSDDETGSFSPSLSSSDRVDLSDESLKLARSDSVYAMDTGAGSRHLDLDTHFLPQAATGAGTLHDLDGLLMPSSKNVHALSEHLSSVFPDFLQSYGIPEAPAKISFDRSGQLVLPLDYPYADELKQAFADTPAMERELQTVNALSSHVAALQALEPFHQEFALANTDAQRELIITRYSHLLSDNRTYPEVSLNFSRDGALTITADGETLA